MSQSSSERGLLIAFEGLDKAGKSTQCERLVTELQKEGREVKHIRFPDRTTPIGQMINSYLTGNSSQEDHVIHLLFSANRWEAAAEIESCIARNVDVVLDRYFYSGCVYSAAKQNPGLDLRWARQPEEGLPRPDVCFFLDISPEDAAKRGGYGEEKYEKQEMQDRVRELFQRMTKMQDGQDFVMVDGGGPADEVAETIAQALRGVSERIHGERLPLRHVEP